MMQFERPMNRSDLQLYTADIARLPYQTSFGEEAGHYLITEPNQVILIEPPNFTRPTRELIEGFGKPARIYMTHAATSGDGDKWREQAGLPLLLNELDLNDQWLSATPTETFKGDFQISEHVCAIHLPDHSDGHTVFFDSRAGGTLFSGDAILLKKGALKLELTRASAEKILALKFERLLPLHYATILEAADVAVHQALRALK